MLGLFMIVFSGCSGSLAQLNEQGIEGFIDGFIEDTFNVYQEFGLILDSETRNLYYNDEQVAFFEDRRGVLDRVVHGDNNASGLHIHAQRDENRNLIGLEVIRR